MIVTMDDCEYAMQRLPMGTYADSEEGQSARDELQAIQVTERDGQFRLTASRSATTGRDVAIDLAPGALRVRSGSVSRWVPLPADALPDQAVVEATGESLTVCMPLRERRPSRHLVYVW